MDAYELCEFCTVMAWDVMINVFYYGRIGLLLFMQEKKALKEEKVKQKGKYMWAIVDGVKEKV